MKSKRKSTESDRLLREALVGLLGLKLRSGATMDEVRSLVSDCTDLADSDSKLNDRDRVLDIHRLASVLRAWHKETRYLSNDCLSRGDWDLVGSLAHTTQKQISLWHSRHLSEQN